MSDEDDEDYGYGPKPLTVTDLMRSRLSPRHVIEVWHDTTMWNEGFEQARDPYVTVVVSTAEDRDAIVSWIEENVGSRAPASLPMDRCFTTRVHAAYADAEPLTREGAAQVIAHAVNQWQGV